MNSKIKLLLATFAVVSFAQVFADADCLDNTQVKGKKCLKANNAYICNTLAVGGLATFDGLITAAVGLTATTGNIVATAGNVTFDPAGAAGTLNALGSLETVGAREIWASVVGSSSPSFSVNSGFATVANAGTGVFDLTFATNFSSTPVIIVTPASGTVAGYMVDVSSPSASGCTVNVFDHTGTSDNAGFNILVIGR